ncbi:glycosyltransferase [Nocardioides convexus]|uniref:glycosyltransferase n=1 Tax=Nocardioides convexus TaxID=2712224 RepID=UPI0024189B4A|nr:glycosyltransferase [Nocardioides convexus]
MHAGPFEGLSKEQACPASLCVFAREVLRAEAAHPAGHFDVVHSHYWLSGQVGALARDRWGVPLVHSMHTMAKVKNEALAEGDTPEPLERVIGEEQVVEAADVLIANTDLEAKQTHQPVRRRAGSRRGRPPRCRHLGLPSVLARRAAARAP